MKVVLLFSTVAAAHLAARLHSSECPMVKNASTKGGRRSTLKCDEGVTQEDVDDLNARGWPVKRCKCLKGCEEGPK